MSKRMSILSRREMLKAVSAGVFGAALGRAARTSAIAEDRTDKPAGQQSGKSAPFAKTAEPARVSLVKGNDRRDIVYQALKNIEDEVLASIGNKKILIKPNFVSTDRQLAATHADAIRGILDFLKPHYKKQIIVGESTASKAGTFDGYKNFGYLALETEYNIKLVDLNNEPWQYRYVFAKGNRPVPIRIISTFLDPDVYIISAARMKTHDRVVTTLSIKNTVLGAPLNDYKKNDKWLTHTAFNFSREAVLHFNMFHLAQEIYPDLGVIDGFEAMEGNGPIGGTPVDARLAMVSMDPLALDTLCTKLMGFDPTQIMYLSVMAEAGMGQGDLSKIKVLGTPADQCQFKFKPHQRMIEPYSFG